MHPCQEERKPQERFVEDKIILLILLYYYLRSAASVRARSPEKYSEPLVDLMGKQTEPLF